MRHIQQNEDHVESKARPYEINHAPNTKQFALHDRQQHIQNFRVSRQKSNYLLVSTITAFYFLVTEFLDEPLEVGVYVVRLVVEYGKGTPFEEKRLLRASIQRYDNSRA
jgi:hypothetical protein